MTKIKLLIFTIVRIFFSFPFCWKKIPKWWNSTRKRYICFTFSAINGQFVSFYLLYLFLCFVFGMKTIKRKWWIIFFYIFICLCSRTAAAAPTPNQRVFYFILFVCNDKKKALIHKWQTCLIASLFTSYFVAVLPLRAISIRRNNQERKEKNAHIHERKREKERERDRAIEMNGWSHCCKSWCDRTRRRFTTKNLMTKTVKQNCTLHNVEYSMQRVRERERACSTCMSHILRKIIC